MELLKNYIFNCCIERAKDYNRESPKNWREAKKMIIEIFDAEKGFEVARIGRRQAFKNWILGLCFISPIMEDLTPYTTRTRATEEEKENDTEQKIYYLIYFYN